MIEKIVTKNNKSFVIDSETLKNEHGILRGTFLMLFANKIIRTNKNGKVNVAYEYSNHLFNDMNICSDSNVVSRNEASSVELSLYNMILNGQSLTDEVRKELRDNYLEELYVDAREQAVSND